MSSPASFPFYHRETFDFRENDLQSKICEIHRNDQSVEVAAIENGR